MLVWRLCSRRRIKFDGEGARRFGGRWNHRGTRVVYTSATLSLAAMELLVHLDRDLEPPDLVAVPAFIPEGVEVRHVEQDELPAGWRRYPAPERLGDVGSSWVRAATTAVLSVPSAVIPSERNYLLNPLHPEFRRIRVRRPLPFRFDPRSWK